MSARRIIVVIGTGIIAGGIGARIGFRYGEGSTPEAAEFNEMRARVMDMEDRVVDLAETNLRLSHCNRQLRADVARLLKAAVYDQ